MKNITLNKIILKTGEVVEIRESAYIPSSQKIMYKIEHEQDKVVISQDEGKTIIPVDNILYASSTLLECEEENEIKF